MANQQIALQARAPQTDILGGAIQRNAQMMNMMAQQRVAERQAAQAEQKMKLDAALAVPQQAQAQALAQSAKLKYVTDFFDTSALALSKVRNAQEAQGIAQILRQHFPDMDQAIAQTMSSLPSDPAQFETWRQRTLYQTMDAKEQLKQKFIDVTTGDQTYTMATPEYAGGGMPTTEVPGTRVKAPQGITYVRGQNGEIIPMPTKTTGGEGSGLVGGPRGGVAGALQTNPGALKDGAFAKSQPGYTGASGGFATFATPEAGIAAQEALLRGSYVNKGYNTIDKIVNRYAPPGPENSAASVSNYKKYIAGQTGIDINQPITAAQVPAVAKAMREFETGQRPGGGARGVQFGRPIEGTGKAPDKTSKSASTEGERRFGTVSKNMTANIGDLVDIIKNDPSAVKPGMGEYVASGIPFIGEEARKWAQSAGRQQFEAAILAVLDNITYINTGAGTSKSQEANYYKSYVPSIQDDDASAKKKLERMVRFAKNTKDAAGVMWTPEMDAQLAGLERAIAGLNFGGSKPAPAKAPAKAPANLPRTKSGATVSNW